MKSLLHLICCFFVLLSLLVTGGQAQARTCVTAETVRSLLTSSTLNQVQPAVSNCPGLPECSDYLEDYSCLGPYGPISCYGPLASLGPVESVSNWMGWASAMTSAVMQAMTNPLSDNDDTWGQDFTGLAQRINKQSGPMSAFGPLGQQGPLGPSYYTTMPSINDFTAQLAAQGVWTVLGPIGPLGALGPLGPLGPVGAHQYTPDSKGRYLDRSGNVMRQYTVQYNSSTQRVYDLYERYDPTFAAGLSFTDNDCSWFVHGSVPGVGKTKKFKFSSSVAQYVTVLLVPHYQLDDLSLGVYDNAGNLIASSKLPSSTEYINWVQILVPAGQQMEARVTLSSTSFGAWWQHLFYLYVTGSTNYMLNTYTAGPHIVSC